MPASARKAVTEMTTSPLTPAADASPAQSFSLRRDARALSPARARGRGDAVVKLSARDGKFEPLTIEVPAGKRFKIEVSNDGKGPDGVREQGLEAGEGARGRAPNRRS
jgi:hypothetical protein